MTILNELLRGIPLQSESLSEGFILVKKNEKFEYKKYNPNLTVFRMDHSFNITINKIDLFSQPIFSIDKLIENSHEINLPLPKKEFLNVNVGCIPTSEPNYEIREIRMHLIDHPSTDFVSLDGVDYIIEVDKSKSEQLLLDYLLFDPAEYIEFEKKLNAVFLEICKSWNDKEHNRLLKRIDELNHYPKSESAEKISKYLAEVKFKFDEWFRYNNVELLKPKLEKTEEKEIPQEYFGDRKAVLKEFVSSYLEKNTETEKGNTIPSKVITFLYNQAIKEGLTKAKDRKSGEGIIRKICSTLGYSKVRRNYY